MSKEKCWVFVDKDGTEKISNSEPILRQFKGKRILSAMRGTPNDKISNYKLMLVGVSCIYAVMGS